MEQQGIGQASAHASGVQEGVWMCSDQMGRPQWGNTEQDWMGVLTCIRIVKYMECCLDVF